MLVSLFLCPLMITFLTPLFSLTLCRHSVTLHGQNFCAAALVRRCRAINSKHQLILPLSFSPSSFILFRSYPNPIRTDSVDWARCVISALGLPCVILSPLLRLLLLVLNSLLMYAALLQSTRKISLGCGIDSMFHVGYRFECSAFSVWFVVMYYYV